MGDTDMSGDALSQNQVENLVRAMADIDGDVVPARTATDQGRDSSQPPLAASTPTVEASSEHAPEHAGEIVHRYDFREPVGLSKECLRTLQDSHTAAAEQFAESVSTLLRSECRASPVTIRQTNYEKFSEHLPRPGCYRILQVEPLSRCWLVSLDPILACTIVARMLGGEPSHDDPVSRPPTAIEGRLIGRVVQLISDPLGAVWGSVVSLKISESRAEHDPRRVQLVPPEQRLIVVSFELTVDQDRGRVELAMPLESIEGLLTRLSSVGWLEESGSPGSTPARGVIRNRIDTAHVDVVVTLARSTIRTKDLIDLSIGDVVTTEQNTSAPLELAIQGIPKFHAAPGSLKGKTAVRIDRLIEKP